MYSHKGNGDEKKWLLLMYKQGIGDVVSSLPAIRAKIEAGYSLTVRGIEFYKSIYEKVGCTYSVIPSYVLQLGDTGIIERATPLFGNILSLNEWGLDEIRATHRHTTDYIKLFAEILDVDLPASFDFREYLGEPQKGFYIIYAPFSAATYRTYPRAEKLYRELAARYDVITLDQQERMPGSVHCKTFEEIVSYIAGAAKVYSVDTGILHIACALGIPTVGIFGTTDGDVIMGAYDRYVQGERTALQGKDECTKCNEFAELGFLDNRCKGRYVVAKCLSAIPIDLILQGA